MATSRNQSKRNAYPYSIPPLKLPGKLPTTKIELWVALECFRIEALLRSKPFQDAYRPKGRNHAFEDLCHQYDIWEDPLEGLHHQYLNPTKWNIPKRLQPVQEIRIALRQHPGMYDKFKTGPVDCTVDLPPGLSLFNLCKNRWVTVALDTSFAPQVLLDALQPYLMEHHDQVKGLSKEKGRSPNKGTDIVFSTPFSPFKQIMAYPHKYPPIRDIKAWKNFLCCYDLLTQEGMSFGKIALKVYGRTSENKTKEVKRSIQKVSRLIECAVNNWWPPQFPKQVTLTRK
jgi:hypothetical protein